MKPICPYCQQPAKLVDGLHIYPHRKDLQDQNFWVCDPCDAYVGCHAPNKGYGDGTRPLGTMANAELRALRKKAHSLFDPLWKSRLMTRSQAYQWMVLTMQISPANAHIGMFDKGQCERLISELEKLGVGGLR